MGFPSDPESPWSFCPMTADELFREGRLDEALEALQMEIRRKPADAKLRIFLFQLLAVNGAWERAHNQLKVLAEMTAESTLLAAVFKHLIELEAFRAKVFSGERTPLFFGEPAPFAGHLVSALSASTPGLAMAMRAKALEEAPAIGGRCNETPFEWVMDADARLGPVLEVAIERKYYWLPLQHLSVLTIETPKDLRDLIWMPADFKLTNGGQVSGFIFARYPGTEKAADPAVRLGRMTSWEALEDGSNLGLGQRVFATDSGDEPLLEIRKLEFDHDDGNAGE